MSFYEILRWLLGFPSSLYEYIKIGDLSILLLLHGELDGCLLGVQVSQELIQGLGVMWPDGEDIIYIPYPEGRSPEGGF